MAMTAIKPTDARTTINRWRHKPNAFVAEVLGISLFDKQREIIDAVAVHRRTSVVGANSTGKDYLSGSCIIPWWLLSHYEPAAVVVTGPTYRQVDDIVWRNARISYREAKVPLGGKMYDGEPRYEIDDSRYAIGFVTDEKFNLQGFHNPHLLIIVTESHAVDQAYIETLKKLNPERILLTGNPFALGGEFYDSHHANRELYHCVTISAMDTPNIQQGHVVIPGMVTVEDIAERKSEWGEESPLYQASVLSKFPDNLDDALVSLTAALAAVSRKAAPEGKAILGVDVARFGEDATVFYRRQGWVCNKVAKMHGRDTMRVVGEIQRVLDADPLIDVVIVDDTGVGGGVTDRLREIRRPGVRIIPFIAGAKAKDEKNFFNATAEAWWQMGRAFRDGRICIDDDKPLIAQVTTRHYTIQSDKTIRLEGKEDIRKRGGKSPDDADALAMTFSPLCVRGNAIITGEQQTTIFQGRR